MSGTTPEGTGLPEAARRARLLKVVLGLLVTVALVVIPLCMPSTLGRFTASVTNSTNTGKVMPFFSCREALTKETGQVFAYQLNNTSPANLAPGATGQTTTQNVQATTSGTTGCKHDSQGYMTFAGNTSKASTVNYANSGDPSSTYTQEIWFRTRAPGSLMGMVNKTDYRTELKFDRELYVGASGRLTMARYSPTGGGPQGVQSPAAVTDGNWHHVVASHDGAGMVASLYLDGNLVGTMNAPGDLESYTPNFWRLGCTRIHDGGWTDGPAQDRECFNGDMAFAAVYSRAFTQQDVTSHYKAAIYP